MKFRLALLPALLVGFSLATLADDTKTDVAAENGEAFAKVTISGMT
ncbi:MAG TPA: hypothetical protein VFF73_10150 [Planctomycetota bacterium]|nr:hypothetical protein [Planctomycetota bacterium]